MLHKSSKSSIIGFHLILCCWTQLKPNVVLLCLKLTKVHKTSRESFKKFLITQPFIWLSRECISKTQSRRFFAGIPLWGMKLAGKKESRSFKLGMVRGQKTLKLTDPLLLLCWVVWFRFMGISSYYVTELKKSLCKGRTLWEHGARSQLWLPGVNPRLCPDLETVGKHWFMFADAYF